MVFIVHTYIDVGKSRLTRGHESRVVRYFQVGFGYGAWYRDVHDGRRPCSKFNMGCPRDWESGTCLCMVTSTV